MKREQAQVGPSYTKVITNQAVSSPEISFITFKLLDGGVNIFYLYQCTRRTFQASLDSGGLGLCRFPESVCEPTLKLKTVVLGRSQFWVQRSLLFASPHASSNYD